MAKFTVTIDTENDAFERPNGEKEIGHILRVVAGKVENGKLHGKIQDSNGNTVGEFKAEG